MRQYQKNRKGFTLVEVLGVIVILSVIVLIVYPVISGNITKGKKEAYDTNINTIKKAAENWLNIYAGNLPEEDFTVYLLDLKSQGLIDKDIYNPIEDKKFPDDMEILVIYGDKDTYTPEVIPGSGTDYEETPNEGKIILLLKGTKVEYIEINSEYYAEYRPEDITALYPDGSEVDPKEIKISYKQYINGRETGVQGSLPTITDPKNPPKALLDTSDFYTYIITYEVTNNGVTSKVTRKVIVRDTIAPKLDIPVNQTISKTTEPYNVMDGVSASDNFCDKKGSTDSEKATCNTENITIKTYGNVVTNVPGEYTITYIATDPSGNESKKTRTITVVDEKCPTIKIKGTTESGVATTNEKVTLTAVLSKGVNYTDTTKLQWQKCTKNSDGSVGVCQNVEGANGEVFVATDYAVHNYGIYRVILYKNGIECARASYETNIQLPKFECKIVGAPEKDTWVREAELTVNAFKTSTGIEYQIDGGSYGSNNKFTANQYRDYVANVRNSYGQTASCKVRPNIDSNSPNINIKVYKKDTNTTVPGGNITNADIDLGWVNHLYQLEISTNDTHTIDGKVVNESGVKELWVNGVKQSNPNTYRVNVSEGTQTYEIKVIDNVGRERIQTVTLRSDATKPVCGSNTGSTTWTNKPRTITQVCQDSVSGCKSGNSINSTLNFSQTFTTDMTKSTIRITDAAGNYTDCPVNVYIDTQPPTCTLNTSGNRPAQATNNYYWGDVTVSFGAKNDPLKNSVSSGIKSVVIQGTNSETKLINYNTNGETVTGIIIDNAGNQNTCSAVVKLDKNNPTCTTSLLYNSNNAAYGSTWTNQDIKVYGTCGDVGSGCTGNVSIVKNTDMKGSVFSPGTVKDNSGRTATCPNSAGIYIDKTKPTCAFAAPEYVSGNTITTSYADTNGSGVTGWNYDGTAAYKDMNTFPKNYKYTMFTSTSCDTKADTADASDKWGTIYVKDVAGNVGSCSKRVRAAHYQNTNTGVYYHRLKDAFNAAGNGQTIKTLTNFVDRWQAPLKGKTLTLTVAHTLSNLSDVGKAKEYEQAGFYLTGNANLTVNGGGKLTNNNNAQHRRLFTVKNSTLNLSNITLDKPDAPSQNIGACVNATGSTININGSTIRCSGQGVSVGNSTTLNIENSKIYGQYEQAIVCGYRDGKINTLHIKGGRFCSASSMTTIHLGYYNNVKYCKGSIKDAQVRNTEGLYFAHKNNVNVTFTNVKTGTTTGAKCRSLNW